MKENHDYLNDIAEIRSMMERTSKFISLSGWAGTLAGVYALAGAWIAHSFFEFQPDDFIYTHPNLRNVTLALAVVLILALITAFLDSRKKASQRDEKAWNATSKRMLASMAVPLLSGGLLILVAASNGLLGLAAPLTLLFYGLALYNAGFYTFKEVRVMGLVQIALGLLNAVFIGYGLLFWAIGFGAVHIIYGTYMHFRYKR